MMNGIYFGSLEGFLQGLRVKNPEYQKVVFQKHGIDAKRIGYRFPIKNQTLYYLGVVFNRHSTYYVELLERAFNECIKQNEIFRNALEETKDMELIHSIGKDDPNDTILTNAEFLGLLMDLRGKV